MASSLAEPGHGGLGEAQQRGRRATAPPGCPSTPSPSATRSRQVRPALERPVSTSPIRVPADATTQHADVAQRVPTETLPSPQSSTPATRPSLIHTCWGHRHPWVEVRAVVMSRQSRARAVKHPERLGRAGRRGERRQSGPRSPHGPGRSVHPRPAVSSHTAVSHSRIAAACSGTLPGAATPERLEPAPGTAESTDAAVLAERDHRSHHGGTVSPAGGRSRPPSSSRSRSSDVDGFPAVAVRRDRHDMGGPCVIRAAQHKPTGPRRPLRGRCRSPRGGRDSGTTAGRGRRSWSGPVVAEGRGHGGGSSVVVGVQRRRPASATAACSGGSPAASGEEARERQRRRCARRVVQRA